MGQGPRPLLSFRSGRDRFPVAADKEPEPRVSPLVGIGLKVLSTMAFAVMAVLIKLIADRYPVGEITFCRSFFALIPVFVWVAWRGQLTTVFRTRNIGGHILRSIVGTMAILLGFAALARLPLADATAIGYASPLLTVMLAALILRETVRAYRWSAVLVGLLGVLIILSDYVAPAGAGAERSVPGAALQLASAFFAAFAAIQIRRLSVTEPAATIVVYFSLFCAAVSLATLPFGWVAPTGIDALILVGTGLLGGLGQVLMTQSFRYADASVLAPFDYVSMVWALTASIFLFGSLPTPTMLVGAAVVIASGLFVVYRERRLGIARSRSKPAQLLPPPLT